MNIPNLIMGRRNPRKKKFTMTKKLRDKIFVCQMLIVPIAHFLVFWLYLNFSSIMIAFQNPVTGGFDLINFERFFSALRRDFASNGTLKIAIQNTVITMCISNFVNMPLVIFASFALFKKFYGHMFYRIVFYLPGIIGNVIIVTMKTYLLDATGPIVALGKAMGVNWSFDVLQSGLLGNVGSARATFFITSIGISGGTVLMLTGALSRIPKDLFDSAKLDGVGIFREFYYIALPLIWSTVGIMWIMSFVGGWSGYDRVLLLTNGAYNTTSFGFYMMNSTLGAVDGSGNFNYPAAMGLLLTGIMAPIAVLLRWLSRKAIQPVEY